MSLTPCQLDAAPRLTIASAFDDEARMRPAHALAWDIADGVLRAEEEPRCCAIPIGWAPGVDRTTAYWSAWTLVQPER